MRKFHLTTCELLRRIGSNEASGKDVIERLRPSVRDVILSISAGKRVPPE